MTIPRLSKKDLTPEEVEQYEYLVGQGRHPHDTLIQLAWLRKRKKAYSILKGR